MLIKSIELHGFKRFALTMWDVFKYSPEHKIQLLLGSNGSGKAQPLNAFIKVPGGWALMSDMEVGKEIIAYDGSTTVVTGVHPQGKKDVYTVQFADGRIAKATEDHLWRIYIGGKKYPIIPNILTTKEIIKLLSMKTYGHLLWVDLIESENIPDIDLPIDPYILGVLLGDGCLNRTTIITNPELHLMEKIQSRLPEELTINVRDERKCLTYSIVGKEAFNCIDRNTLSINLEKLGLRFKRSYEKFIPEEYLHASTKQRLDLLNGLMDTGGTISKNGTSSYCTTSRLLAENIQYLIRSLGGIASISTKYTTYASNGIKLQGRLAYQINIRYKKPSELFTVPKRKARTNDNNQYAKALKLRILSITKTSHEETQCITIAHPDRLYVTDNFVVTHNSSIMRELSPLPANSSDFRPGGSKIIEIEQAGHHYKLTSSFTGSPKHSFMMDGCELNTGGTGQVQKDLVASHFNITSDVHEVMVGLTNFTTMSVATRREWFTRLSNINFNYAIGIYQKLKSKLRDVDGALKFQQSLMVSESAKLLDAQAVIELEKEVNETKQLIDYLIDAKSQIHIHNTPIDDVHDRLRTHMAGFKATIQSILGSTDMPPIEALSIVRATAIAELSLGKKQYTNYLEQLEELQSLIRNVEKISVTELQNLDQEISHTENSVERLKSNIKYLKTPRDPIVLSNAIELAYDTLYEHIKDLPSNSDKRFSKANYESFKIKLSNTQSEIQKLQQLLTTINNQITQLEHFRDHKQTTCPQCNHIWSQGYDQHKYQDLKSKSVNISEQLKSLNAVVIETEKAIQDILDYFSHYQVIVRCRDQISVLEDVWKYIGEHDLITNQPSMIIQVLEQSKYDIPLLLDIQKLNEKLSDLQKLAVIKSSNQITDIEKLKRQHLQLEDLIAGTQQHIKEHNVTIEYLDRVSSFYTEMEKYIIILETDVRQHDLAYKQKIASLKHQTLSDLIRSMQLTLNDRQHQLNTSKTQSTVVANIQKNIDDLTLQQYTLSAMVAELSPKDGLIAKSLSGFINSFVNKINRIIAQIWLYPFELVPIDLESDGVDLDYRFEVKVNNQTMIPDIGKCSSGMREVVDLAFRIVAMGYLGLDHAPIYMDEFGKSMDSAHRIKAFDVISKLITHSNYSQIFMVSHHEQSYGSLKNADIVVLSPDNVVIPTGSIINQVITTH